jgi:hypothetical protein
MRIKLKKNKIESKNKEFNCKGQKGKNLLNETP